MSYVFEGLKPESVWKHFATICSVPHPSKKEAKIIEVMKNFGEQLGLETIVDEVGNVIIKKPATPGHENKKGVILQAHLDMVPQKNSDINHDFEADPIETMITDGWVTANGTTLGADNGIGVAAAMAVLESKELTHGPVEALFTIDEETGMTGAFELKSGLLDGDILLNLDSEDEGELYIGCAGGVNTNITMKYVQQPVQNGYTGFELNISGLKGGHSGMDIILERGNAVKILNRIIWTAEQNGLKVQLASFNGGDLRNAIPREAKAIIAVAETDKEAFKTLVAEQYNIIKNEIADVDEGLAYKLEETNAPEKVFDAQSQTALINAIYGCPHGVYRMSKNIKGVVETSTNLAAVNTDGNGKTEIISLQRSSVDSAKDDLAQMIHSVFKLAGAEIVHDGQYPGWKPNAESAILKTMKEGYQELYGKQPEVKVIHAGLECGILGSHYPNWDMISFGPTIRFPHSPDEKVNIETVDKFWKYLVYTLEHIPTK